MDEDLYLLWIPNGGWGVFGYGCLDTGAFPNWMYKKYTIPSEQRNKVFERLMKIKERLEVDKVAIIVWGETPVATLIKSKEVAKSYKNYFELLWKIAKT